MWPDRVDGAEGKLVDLVLGEALDGLGEARLFEFRQAGCCFSCDSPDCSPQGGTGDYGHRHEAVDGAPVSRPRRHQPLDVSAARRRIRSGHSRRPASRSGAPAIGGLEAAGFVVPGHRQFRAGESPPERLFEVRADFGHANRNGA